MAKEIPEDKMDELMETLAKGLTGIFDGVADVKCIKGNKDEIMGQMMSTYMGYPIIRLEMSREGADVRVNKCNIEDVIKALPKAIGTLLGLVPNEYRNDILYKAIHEDMTEDGGLMDRIKENEEEDDE